MDKVTIQKQRRVFRDVLCCCLSGGGASRAEAFSGANAQVIRSRVGASGTDAAASAAVCDCDTLADRPARLGALLPV